MGRGFPPGEDDAEIHPFISISLLIASVAATVSVVSSLCGALSRKKTPPPDDHDVKENMDVNLEVFSPTDENDALDHGYPDRDSGLPGGEPFSQQPLPPPPGKRNLSGSASYHFRSNSSASTSSMTSQLKKLPQSMSMRALGSGIGMGSRQSSKKSLDGGNHDHHKRHKEKKFKHEDSIWKKTIILGEKCKVPDEDDEDTILYDDKGNRIQTYHRKTTSSVLSRQSSSADQDSISSAELGLKDDHHIMKNALAGRN